MTPCQYPQVLAGTMVEHETNVSPHNAAAPALQILIADEQSSLAVEHSRLREAVLSVLVVSDYESATISLAIVDDPTIHEINRNFLQHDYPTDVLSFVLAADKTHLEAELVVSTETAIRNAQEHDWPAENELLLYLVHGTLHLVGYRDEEPNDIEQMHRAEAMHLKQLGVSIPENQTRWQETIRPINSPNKAAT